MTEKNETQIVQDLHCLFGRKWHPEIKLDMIKFYDARAEITLTDGYCFVVDNYDYTNLTTKIADAFEHHLRDVYFAV